MTPIVPASLDTFESPNVHFGTVYTPDRPAELGRKIEEYVLRQVEELGPKYRAGGSPLIARIENAGRTLRVVSGKLSEAGAGFVPCILAELVLKGWEGEDGNPVDPVMEIGNPVKLRLELCVYARTGLSINPDGLYDIACPWT